MPGGVRMSQAVSLGLHTMVFLAGRPGRTVSTRDIARTLGVSEAHLSKVLQRLARVGLVKANRGPGGGFMLAKDRDRVTLMEVYESLEGPLTSKDCVFWTPICAGAKCVFGQLAAKLTGQVKEYMSGTKLSGLSTVYGEAGSGGEGGI